MLVRSYLHSYQLYYWDVVAWKRNITYMQLFITVTIAGVQPIEK